MSTSSNAISLASINPRIWLAEHLKVKPVDTSKDFGSQQVFDGFEPEVGAEVGLSNLSCRPRHTDVGSVEVENVSRFDALREIGWRKLVEPFDARNGEAVTWAVFVYGNLPNGRRDVTTGPIGLSCRSDRSAELELRLLTRRNVPEMKPVTGKDGKPGYEQTKEFREQQQVADKAFSEERKAAVSKALEEKHASREKFEQARLTPREVINPDFVKKAKGEI